LQATLTAGLAQFVAKDFNSMVTHGEPLPWIEDHVVTKLPLTRSG